MTRSVLLYSAWAVALFSLIGSLYFSEVARLTPCRLCVYQRGFMMAIFAGVAMGLITPISSLPYYVLPCALGGMGLAVYHNLLTWKVVTAPVQACRVGVPCTVQPVEGVGFLTIPLLSLGSFVLLSSLLCLACLAPA